MLEDALESWDYGIGESGVFLESWSDLPGALVICQNFPWWIFVAPELGVRVTGVWLWECSLLYPLARLALDSVNI
jgi:hypothetical protein